MAILVWSDKLSVGNAKLDRQHKELVDLVNDFFDAIKSGQAESKLAESVVILNKYVKDHFADEEAYLKSINFPDFLDHKKIHFEMCDKVSVLIRAVETGHKLNMLKVGNFLKDWLMEHIVKEDKKYALYSQETVSK